MTDDASGLSSNPLPDAVTSPANTEPSTHPQATQTPVAAEPAFWTGGQIHSGVPRPKRGLEATLRSAVEWIAVAIGALAAALLIKSFLLQAFYIPSESMVDTLQVNDRVLVNKLNYRFGDIDRGDIIVFKRPPGAGGQINDFIKRVIALPGETVTLVNGQVFIDDVLLDEPYVRGAQTDPFTAAIVSQGCTNAPEPDRCTIADGWYFVMGDNRNSSIDSRSFGPIAEDTVAGRAFLKVWPLGDMGFL
ncbi:MAG: signal peptidase I [Acidimicrobiales bacterium]|nr:signal peptidase I [Acidimicrobiales bacterium]MDG2218845.1 signal peptidase I [Acidimicrobiales bacterium]